MNLKETYNVFDVLFLLEDPNGSTYRETVPGEIYEPAVTMILNNLLADRCKVFADIGSLYGYFAIFAAKANRNVDVYAFEPCPDYCKVIDRNKSVNQCDNVSICNIALSDATEEMFFRGKTLLPKAANTTPSSSLVRTLRATAKDVCSLVERCTIDWRNDKLLGYVPLLFGTLAEIVGESPILKVGCLPYDEWVKNIQVKPDVIKIDVHGAEGKVLNGMTRSLQNDIQHVLLEVHAKQMLVDCTYEDIFNPLVAAGFTLYELDNYRNGNWSIRKMSAADTADICDFAKWSAKQKMMMRMIFASKDSDYVEATYEVRK